MHFSRKLKNMKKNSNSTQIQNGQPHFNNMIIQDEMTSQQYDSAKHRKQRFDKGRDLTTGDDSISDIQDKNRIRNVGNKIRTNVTSK